MYMQAIEINEGNKVKVGANFYQVDQAKHEAGRTIIVFKNQQGEMKVKAYKSNDIVNIIKGA